MSEEAYSKTARNTVKRYAPRGAYDKATIHEIVNTCPVLHVSFIPRRLPSDDDSTEVYPAILPMLGCIGSYGSYEDCIYIHGHVSSRLMKFPAVPSSGREDGPTPTEIEDEGDAGTPLTIAATHLTGLVLALTPFSHSCNYSSAVIHGRAHIVTDFDEKMHAMELITNNVLADRWANSRIPPTKAELQSTTILRVQIESASAKVRTGGPGNERKDEKDESVVGKVWQGVVPSWTSFGEPIAAPRNRVENVPGYMRDWIDETNGKNKKLAENGASAVYGTKS